MYSQNLLQTIKNSQSVLQESLNRGWQEFQSTETFSITKLLSEQMNWWYDSKYYNVIPNPAHWYASQLAGKYFIIELGQLGFYLDTVFPGDFDESEEFVREDGLDVRRFR